MTYDEIVFLVKGEIATNAVIDEEADTVEMDGNGMDHVAENVGDRIINELDRVRKKTIKEVAQYLDNEKGFCGLGYMMAKHFGVEVEE